MIQSPNTLLHLETFKAVTLTLIKEMREQILNFLCKISKKKKVYCSIHWAVFTGHKISQSIYSTFIPFFSWFSFQEKKQKNKKKQE